MEPTEPNFGGGRLFFRLRLSPIKRKTQASLNRESVVFYFDTKKTPSKKSETLWAAYRVVRKFFSVENKPIVLRGR
ncbi:MAG: hypothetical protein EAZ30_10575 [Betaproteobacteria bacterium]|nr:MAG: hypothetical protein EAZ30_10575 [Betaproteobacteria bacterium]